MMKRTVPVLVFLLVAATVAALAAPRVTLILRNGDRIKCELLDLGGSGFEVKSGADVSRLPAGDVALIDYVGGAIPRAEITKMQEGRAFIVLRNGDMVYGRLTDIGGDNPQRLTVRTADGNQEFSSNDVARIFLARWEGM